MPNWSLQQSTTGKAKHGPLLIHVDDSCSSTLRLVLNESPLLFTETDPASADIILFGTDVIGDVKGTALYRSYRAKSVCVTESDIPTFGLPGLYAANQIGLLTDRRTKTINYFLSERERPNPEVKRLVGQPIDKRYLYSFMGGTNSWARRRLFDAVRSSEDTLVESTDAYNHWAGEKRDALRAEYMRLRYAQVMAASKFSLCPRGCGLSSYRLFESMSLGVVPVIMADKWQPIEGIDWSFAIFIRERDIARTDRIIREHAGEWEARGQQGQATYRAVLQPDAIANMLHKQLSELAQSYDPAREAVVGVATEVRAAYREAYWAGYALLKKVVIKASRLSGVAVPVKMRQPEEADSATTGLGVGTGHP